MPRPPAPVTPEVTSGAPAGGEEGVPVGVGRAEALEDAPFVLDTEGPVPPGFREAYGRRARITVQFYKIEGGLGYPEGLRVDRQVSNSMERLRSRYPTIEFFSYDISDPGPAGEGTSLQEGQYGTLAAQLGVGITPFVAMLAPSGDAYVVTNLFQGYVPEPVLSQALYDLSSVEAEDNTSDVDVVLQQVVPTETGGGLEYFSVENRSDGPVDLQGYSLRVLDPETAEADPDAPGVTVNENVEVGPGETASLGRVPDVVTAEGGGTVDGTFEGGEALELAPGDQVALLDSGGAVAHTLTV